MDIRIIPPKQGWRWIPDAWKLFCKDPIGISMAVLAYCLIFTLGSMLGSIGALIVVGFTPLLTVLMLSACRAASMGRPVIHELTTTLQSQQLRMSMPGLLLTGVIYALSLLLVSVFADHLDLQKNILALGKIHEQQHHESEWFLLKVAALALLFTPILMAFWYAPMLVAWHRMTVAKALFFSFFAVLRNRGAFARFGLAWILLAIPVSMLMMFSGLITVLLFGMSNTSMLIITAISTYLVIAVNACSLYPTYVDVVIDDDPQGILGSSS